MKKLLSIATISVVTIILGTGCGSSLGVLPSNAEENSSIYKSEASRGALHVESHNIEKVMHAIRTAGENIGWKMTPFKINEFIAEKTSDGKTVSTNVKFHNEYVTCSKDSASESDIEDLMSAIKKELAKKSSSGH
ncbi:MAG: hypothetical protein A2513_11270 [Sulfurimonas sp. RIFOXYD12_FULL_33_39]|uniref:hypothetical protein n=1 Tax=unclassified Sulfurimonas TaxID=2623549 RepID=UPI0008C54AEA|nr:MULTISPECIES: hypothetical protein [unclassified Sulfurimonas]OHE09876.1 MAG: hypothetical protein A2513_11270 [Sulfurimonas sp. RIFOXYD12_FULL_33_39]OHE13616.1 MAG: hypothetical protein A2530_08485 [Sulfurimonas sp. RIFOXYD2_FULL_34_21]DAB28191.1 MAG TPA: hypothetical protein CFH78_03620 [Sulfurimonas sp. UBA10385]